MVEINNNSRLPNFFIVGAVKAGTTSLHNYLDQHPDIYMSPVKETFYFSKDIRPESFSKGHKSDNDIEKYLKNKKLPPRHQIFINNFENYKRLFREVGSEKIIGETCPGYLYSNVAAKEIYKYNKDAKIVIILRDPINRAYSNFLMQVNDGFIKSDNFIEEVKRDFNQSKKDWGVTNLLVESGLYYNQIKRYFDIFPKKNIKIILYSEYKKQPLNALKNLCLFLGVDNNFVFDLSKKYNQSADYNRIIKIIRNVLDLLGIKKIAKKRKIAAKERDELMPYFKEDILKTQDLINRDLSIWLN